MRRSLRAALPWAVPAVSLVTVVLVLWTGVTGNRMNLGGDDSHLYYLDPWRWLRHGPLTVVDNGFVGFNARVFFVPFVAVVGVLSWLPINVQGLCFGLLLAATWTGVARLVLELLDGRPGAGDAAQVAAAVTTLAPVVAATQWTHQLYPIYWMAALPWLVVFVLRHQAGGAWRWVWLSVATTVGLAPAMSAAPWTAACALLAVPLVAIGLVARRTAFRPGRLVVLAAATAGANLFWMVPMVAAAGSGQVQFSDAASDAGRDSAARTVRTLAAVQQPADTAALRVSSRLLRESDSPAARPNRWSERLEVLGMLPIAVTVAGALAALGHDRRLVAVSAGLFVLWLAFFWLSSVSALPSGENVFVWLTRRVPGWAAFRNFQDKFAIPFASIAGIAAGVGFASLTATWHRRARTSAAAILVAAWAVYGLPLLGGEYFRLPYVGGSTTNRIASGLPASYQELLAAVDDLPPGAVLTVPLRRPAWTLLPTARDSAYVGLSPVNLLTGRSDVNGLDVAPRPARSGVTADLVAAVRRGDVRSVALALRRLGVSHVLVGPPVDNALAGRFGLGGSATAERALWDRYVAEFAPRTVWRRGDLAVHEIDPAWRTDALELRSPLPAAGTGPATDDEEAAGTGCGRPLRWSQASPTQFRATVPARPGGCSVVLRQAFHTGWRARLAGKEIGPRLAEGFATQFPVPPSTHAQVLDVTFAPQRLVPVSAAASIVALAAIGFASLLTRRRVLSGPP
ncbi:MAG: hypothetical protein ACLGI3_15925 [Actinomycetes bacterium]